MKGGIKRILDSPARSSLEICTMKSGKTCSTDMLLAHVTRSSKARTICLCPHSSSQWLVAWNERRIKGIGKESRGTRNMQHFALVYTYLLVDVREGMGPVVMFSELWGFHLPGLPAWLMPMPSLSRVSWKWTNFCRMVWRWICQAAH